MAESTMEFVFIFTTMVYLVLIVVLRNLIVQSTNLWECNKGVSKSPVIVRDFNTEYQI
ncbi:hypothetical protein AAEH72_16500 [Shewanella xiamenensis]|uniref:hypothetical protein n=1 Tax=Shewanella xiamenensis TaxID=332186 RepID=UPI00313B024D